MIISKYNKSYDTADGSEQRYEERQPARGGVLRDVDVLPVEALETHVNAKGGAATGAGAGGQRWEDDGGPPAVVPPVSPLEFSTKPSWSVLSLRDLNLAVRLGDWPDNPSHLRRRAAEAERARVASVELQEQRAASRAHAELHRDRNPWEHS